MKKIFFSSILLFSIASINAQTLFTYGKKTVTKAEFLKAYNKNPNPNETNRKKALQEYLDLYINYKLKVQAAYDDKLNEDPQFKYESSNFKKQIIENHINNEANINELTKEAFTRSQKDIRVAQVFIEVTNGLTNEAAQKKIQQAYEQLKAGKEFGEVAATFSNDEATIQTKGDLGYITVFTLPYEFENEIYKLAKGTFSAPYRSSMGYHIFKNVTERPAVGKRKAQQVLIAVPKDANDVTKAKFEKLADSIYNLAKNGANFEKLVSDFSNDRATYGNKGIMPEISVGQYTTDFEEPIYALPKVGTITKPFLTQHGWHIIKLLEIMPIGKDYNDAVTAALLKQQVERADRLNIAKKGLVKKWMSICGFKPAIFDEKEFLLFTDSTLADKQVTAFKKVTPNTVLFSFTKQKITAADWSKFIKAIKQANNALSQKATMSILREYEQIVCGEYYREHLEEFNADMKEQSREFDEANLLFSAMDKHVWTKANEDTTGLKKFYQQNTEKYKWNAGISAIVVTVTDESLLKPVADSLQKSLNNWRNIVSSYGTSVIADSSRFENGQLPVNTPVENKIGFISKPEKNNTDGSYTFLVITAVHPTVEPRNFEDAKGIVTSDYQLALEQIWIKELRKKYPVTINQPTWQTVK